MGQPVHVMLFAESEDVGLAACADALAELRRVERHLSLFTDSSDLCELNRRAGQRPMRVGEDLGRVLRSALSMRELTAGAFDAAVEPLMRAWGFHRPRSTEPSAGEIADARAAVRAARVELNGEVAQLPSGHTQLDFGGIAVGYGIDRALAVLRAVGIRRAFIDVSGDCGALAGPPGERGWLVDIADPRVPGGVLTTIRLEHAALATSSNAASVRRFGAIVRGHVMDPATGWPAARLDQVSVVASRAIAADALSTAMLVSGRRPAAALEVYSVPGNSPTGSGE